MRILILRSGIAITQMESISHNRIESLLSLFNTDHIAHSKNKSPHFRTNRRISIPVIVPYLTLLPSRHQLHFHHAPAPFPIFFRISHHLQSLHLLNSQFKARWLGSRWNQPTECKISNTKRRRKGLQVTINIEVRSHIIKEPLLLTTPFLTNKRLTLIPIFPSIKNERR